MQTNPPPKVACRRGMSLIELTVVILVFLSLIAIMLIGTRSWIRGSARAACIMNLRNIQLATRSYQNMNGYYFGGQPVSEYGTQDIARHLLEKGFISLHQYDLCKGSDSCDGGGKYSSSAPSVFPFPGALYITCSLAGSENHAPDPSSSAGW